MTEDEAKTKWCPQAQVSLAANEYQSGEAWNKPNDAEWHCIGSGCMAWRWVLQGEETGDGDAPARLTYGYCGLAGKP